MEMQGKFQKYMKQLRKGMEKHARACKFIWEAIYDVYGNIISIVSLIN